MTIEQIPADELTEMTVLWHRVFNAAGCNPGCHGCYVGIEPGDKFKLATIPMAVARGNTLKNTLETKEVMLCEHCDISKVTKKQEEIVDHYNARPSGLGCYRIGGKIVH